MVTSSKGLESKNDYAGEDQQHIQKRWQSKVIEEEWQEKYSTVIRRLNV
jgi:hypothetical protein